MMKLPLSLVLTILTTLVLVPAQIEAGWTKIYENGWDLGCSVMEMMDGGYMIGSNTGGGGGAGLLKVDEYGEVIWERKYEAKLFDAQPISAGGYILTGRVFMDLWLLKTNALGEAIWEKHYNYGGNNIGCNVQETSDGSYIISGIIDDRSCLFKTDKDGDSLWIYEFSEPSGAAYSVQETHDGCYITLALKSRDQISYLYKIDNNGTLIWSKSFQGIACSVRETHDKGLIIGGGHPLIYKTDWLGDSLWYKSYDGGDSNAITCVQQTTDNGYILVTTQPAGRAIWLLKFDSTGDTVGTLTFSEGSAGNVGYWVEQTADDGYILTGSLRDSLCLIKVDAIQDVSEQPVTDVTPSWEATPIGRRIVLRYTNRPDGFHASVFNASGHKVDELHSTQQSGTIYWGQGFSPGVYFIREVKYSLGVTRKVVLVK